MGKYNFKFYLKKNLIGFVVGAIVFSGIGVYAAITFPSNEVSYDNKASGLKSTNVKDAIDELYSACTSKTAAEEIIENAGLEKDPYECRYFFIGSNPNNYITFNGEKAGWRIISAECDGTIKIMKNNSIGENFWSTAGGVSWARPASLNTYLNSTYYSNLTSIAQNQIVSHDWSIGGVDELGKDLGNTVNLENKEKWNGKVSLPTASEYVRTISDESCRTMYQIFIYSNCGNTTWMNNDTDWWTLSSRSGLAYYVIYVFNYGGLSYYNVNSASFNVRPTVYLSSKVKITGGTGTKSDPYTIQ